MSLREAAQQALEALETDTVSLNAINNAASFLRAALEHPEQAEPVAWRYQNSLTDTEYLVWNKGTGGRNWTPLFTRPPRREWRGLTEEAVIELLHSCDWRGMHLAVLVRAIEAALKERNA